MTNNDKPRPLAAIVGERLRLFREEKGLRQEDVAEAARSFGAEWGRSSIAALEGGKRDLRLEELILLSAVISNLGGWEKPFIPRDVAFRITDLAHAFAGEAFRNMARLNMPSEVTKPREIDPEEEDVMRLGAIETPRLDAFEKMQRTARNVIVFDRIMFTLWPDRVPSGGRSMAGVSELTMLMAERVRWPDSGNPVDPGLIGALAYGTWGRTPAEERDARTDSRGSYETKRALQSARGHVTRELIAELQATLDSRFSDIRAIIDGLESVIGDEKALKRWVDVSYEIQDKVREAKYYADLKSGEAGDEGKKPARVFRRRGGKHGK